MFNNTKYNTKVALKKRKLSQTKNKEYKILLRSAAPTSSLNNESSVQNNTVLLI